MAAQLGEFTPTRPLNTAHARARVVPQARHISLCLRRTILTHMRNAYARNNMAGLQDRALGVKTSTVSSAQMSQRVALLSFASLSCQSCRV